MERVTVFSLLYSPGHVSLYPKCETPLLHELVNYSDFAGCQVENSLANITVRKLLLVPIQNHGSRLGCETIGLSRSTLQRALLVVILLTSIRGIREL